MLEIKEKAITRYEGVSSEILGIREVGDLLEDLLEDL